MKQLAFLICTALCIAASQSAERTSPSIGLSDFRLTGDLTNGQADFTLTATARVESRDGGAVELLSGPVALTEVAVNPRWTLRPEQNRFVAVFDRRGTFPIRVRFTAAVKREEGWRRVEFRVAPTALQPVTLSGLPVDTEFDFRGAARPERSGTVFRSYLPPDGTVSLAWKETRPEGEGKLFYSAEMLSQIIVSPGLVRQVALLNFKVMQGELSRVAVVLRGEGEVTRVQGEHILAWNIEPLADPKTKRLVVQLNQPQKDQFTLQVQLQTALGAFPQASDVIGLRPEAATRFAGFFRIVNEGAVSLEVLKASGLTQISPEQFPESDASRAAFRSTGTQRFAYRFSGEDFALRIQADQIVPEVSVSELLAYRLGENELAIDSELELEIREAPLRELLVHIPKNYAVARVNAAGLADYFLTEPEDKGEADLRLVFGQPITGHEIVELRLERNKPLGETTWTLPRVEVGKAKSVRGHIAVSAEAGFRISPERTQALTEIATAFFPRKIAGIQAAFRLSDATWLATMRVERLPQTVQADGLHLFSIGEGIAYGSSLVNYVISGAPIAAFKIQLSKEYFNVEFTGKDVRNWQRTEDGYLVQLHTPVSGAYTLLATYERPFKAQGDTLTFTGARPADAQSEQGHTLIVSAYQFQVRPVEISPGLLPLEPGEVPSEYRLFFDAPILAAYRYVAQPFNLKLALNPLVQGDSLNQVVDRAVLSTRISKEGQILTDVHYFIKSRGSPHFRLTLPTGTELWSATVNGAAVVPVADAGANLVPLPQGLDPNAVINLELQLAAKASEAERVRVSAPITGTPVMLTDWKLEPDTGQRLVYRAGSLQPTGGVLDSSGFTQIARMFKGEEPWRALLLFVVTPGLVLGALIVWRRTRVTIGSGSGTRDWAGGIVGILVMLFAAVCFAYLLGMASRGKVYAPRDLSFVAPIQQAGSIQVIDVANMPEEEVLRETLRYVWPGLLALPLWVFGWVSSVRAVKRMSWIAGWAFLAWAALRSPNGAVAFLILSGSFVTIHAIIPALMQFLRARPELQPAAPIKPIGGASSAATALLIGGLVWISESTGTRAASSTGPEVSSQRTEPVVASATVELSAATIAESIMQDVRVESGFVFAKANIRWRAEKGQALPVLFEPGVLTGINYPTNALRLMQAIVPRVRLEGSAATNLARAQVLTAQRRGVFDIEIRYELQLRQRGPETGFESPTGYGLVNRLDMTVRNAEVDIFSSQAVSVSRAESNTNTVARLVLSPGADAWIGWRPRARDVTREKTTFYAEVSQLYVPTAGVIDGAHYVSIRPAQGELHELTLDVPSGVSITDVSDVATNQPPTEAKVPIGNTGLVSLWRFDPDARKLRITLGAAQSHPFAFLVRSQSATGGLPLEHSVGLVSVDGAADQIGLLAIATGSEVQLDSVSFEGLSPINLEDFPAELTTRLQSQFGGLAVRRAFRYANLKASASLKASAVEPDVRVESQDTLSLGEDRTVLAANASVEITRAGIFRMSFEMPVGYEVESISGSALSHWTELKSESGRTITLHLNGKTEGKQQFAITLAGAGVKATNSWPVPQLVFREATKQRGTLLIVPEQGLRLQAGASEGLTQLDPQKSGIKQKGVLAFRALQTPHSLALDIERVDPWIQVTSLQQSTLTEAQIRVAANLQYQIENTGLKSFRVLIPTNAEAVRFEGEQVADFVADPASITNGLQAWNITLHRRVIGQYLLQASYQVSLAGTAAQAVIRGIQALDVNAQRGFLTVRSAGRLQVALDSLPSALQPAEWQSIPRTLQQGLPAGAASFSYRLVDAAFKLPLKIERHEAAKLLPARVNSISLNSVISDDGIMLTQVRLEMLPGDKRLLNLTLPKDARFWFAFVNRNGIWPWREQDRILIPLEQESGGEKAMPVELFYSCRVGSASSRELNLDLLAPKFDLPLENLTWRVSLDRKWKIKKWSGSFQLQQEDIVVPVAGVDLERYLQSEVAQQREQTKAAEDLLATGNSALAQGAPQQARRAFKAAYELSGHDSAFNEDARVQLHNVKLQQALIGLNVRQAVSGGEGGTLAAKLRDLRGRKELSYTQQDAKDIIDRNSADENAAYMRLAERLIQQQDAAVSSPTALRASIPDQGRVLTFKRAVVVDPWADLKITLIASGTRAAGWGLRALILLCTCGVFLIFGWIGLRPSQTPSTS